MKALSALIASLAATLAIATFVQAEEEKHIKLVLQTSPEAGLVTFETGELALGETRAFTSEKGRPVLLTKTEQGFEIDVDGKKTQIDLPEAGGEGFEWETREGEAAAGGEPRIERHVIVKRMGGDAAIQLEGGGQRIEIHAGEPVPAGKEVRVIHLGEGHAAGEGGKRVIVLGGDGDFPAARAKLLASGALDGLDPATRDKILAALGQKNDGK